MSFYNPAVQAWRPFVEALADGLPGTRAVDRVLQWISIESDGNECSTDFSRKQQIAAGWNPDAGVLQIFFNNANSISNPNETVYGATSASLRANCNGVSQNRTYALSDDQKLAVLTPQMAWLKAAVASAQAELDAFGIQWQERDVWRWYKLRKHGVPVMYCFLWMTVQSLGRPPVDWDEFESTAKSFSTADIQAAGQDPAANLCTNNLAYSYLWASGWKNAHEMDLPDEAPVSAVIDAISDVVSGTWNDTVDVFTGNAGLTNLEMGLVAIGAVAAIFGGFAINRRLATKM